MNVRGRLWAGPAAFDMTDSLPQYYGIVCGFVGFVVAERRHFAIAALLNFYFQFSFYFIIIIYVFVAQVTCSSSWTLRLCTVFSV